ncbi:MAG TPA: type II secretion system protein GspG [Phycisphaerae bacterium]|jgi:hypothetical protein
MARSRSDSALGLLAAVTVVLVVAVAVIVFRVLREERAAVRTPTTPVGTNPQEAEDRARATERVTLAVGANGPIPNYLQLFRHRAGRYPNSLDELLTRPADLEAGQTWNGPHVGSEDILRDPWGQRYHYRAPGIHNTGSYDLWSSGPDGVEDTADDIGNW